MGTLRHIPMSPPAPRIEVLRPGRMFWAVGIVVLASLAGCDTADTEDANLASGPIVEAGSHPECAESATRSPEAVSVRDALPADGIVTQTWEFPRPETFDGREFYPSFMNLASDGSFLAEGILFDARRERVGRSELELWTETTRDPVDIGPSFTDHPTRVSREDRFGETIAWVETSSQSMYGGDWAIYARHEGTTRIVATSFDLSENGYTRTVDTPPYPTLTASKVYWNAVRPKPGVIAGDNLPFDMNDHDILLLARDLEAATPVEVVSPPDLKVAVHAADEAGNLYYMVRNFPELDFQIIKRYPDGSEQSVHCGTLEQGQYVTAMAASNSGVAWAWSILSPDGRSDHQELGITVATAETLLEVEDTDGALDLSMSGDLLAWGNGSGFHDPSEYVLHLRSHQIVKVGEAQGFSEIAVAGNQLAWALPVPKDSPKQIMLFVFGELSDDFVSGRT